MKLLVLSILLLCACSDDPMRRPDVGDVGDVADGDADGDDVADTGDVPAEILEPLALGEPVPAGRVLAGVATRPEQLVGGPKAEGLIGDLVLANARATFVVEGARRAGGYRMWGGHLVDVVVAGQLDRFGEIWFAWNLEAFVPSEATVISTGEDGVAHVRLRGRTGPYPWPDSFLRPLLRPAPADLAATYDYRLRPDAARLELTVTLSNEGADEVDLELPMVAMNMGDGVKSYAPGGGFGAVQAGQGMAWIGAIGPDASYAMASSEPLGGVFSYANVDILTLPEQVIAPGASATFDFAFLASSDGTPGLDALRPDTQASETIEGTLADANEGAAWVAITQDYIVGALAIVRDGRFAAKVPPGVWTVQAFSAVTRSAPQTVATPARDVALRLETPGVVSLVVNDQDTGAQLPAQVTFFPSDEGWQSPLAPPAVRVGRDWGAGRATVVFTGPSGDTNAFVYPGRYRVVASRGYSYELATAELVVEGRKNHGLQLVLARAVDTTGWSAADFHLHAKWSSDSDVPYDTRVRQAAASDVALPVLTEHAYVGDLMSAAELAGVSDWVTAIAAQEVTTFEYGHFNAFPLLYDPDAPSGGAVFEHGHEGAGLFAAMRAQQPERVIIQVNHPRSTSLIFSYFDYLGLDAVTGVAANPARFSTDWDMIEVFNGRCLGSDRNTRARQDWIDLTNLGWRKTLSSGSDSHSEGAGVGHPRSWVKVEQTAVALDPQAIVAPLMARQAFVSCGPFVRFATSDGVGLGGIGAVDREGAVDFAVTVEAPTWIGVDAINLLENGVVIATHTPKDAHRGEDPEHPARRFDGTFTAHPTKDAWYAIEVIGSGSLAPVEMDDTPYALTNPIEVDADGDGLWTPPGAVPAPR